MFSFIAASAYKYIFLALVAILTYTVSNTYKVRNGLQEFRYAENEALKVALVLFLIFFIGLRPANYVFVDMMNYIEIYNAQLEGAPFSFDWQTDNLIFDNLFNWWGAMRLGTESFFFVLAVIYFGCAYLGIRRIFPTHKLPAYLVFLGAFSTFSYATNGVKAGAAASLFIWAMGYRQNLKICIPLVLASLGFHHSMQLPVAAFVLTWFYKNPKWYYYAWAFCMLMAFLHVGFFASLFAGYSDESGANYLAGAGEEGDGTKGGFRIDFILYSAVPVVIGYIMEMKRKVTVSPLYRDLIHLYICINGIWMLCMYASYTNRIAYLSWFLYPIVLIFPFLYENWGQNKYRMFSKMMLYHLAFTVFMELIYYR